MREVAHLCNCIQTSPRRVVPIFYDVDTSHVRNQSGCYEIAFAKYAERLKEDKENTDEMQRWREALTRVASVSGNLLRVYYILSFVTDVVFINLLPLINLREVEEVICMFGQNLYMFNASI